MPSDTLGFDSEAILESGEKVNVCLFQYTDQEKAIKSELEALTSIFWCDADHMVKKGDQVTIKNECYYIDQCINTGIGLTEVRLKCVKEQKSGLSLGKV